jgi:Domain of unknown function (DUF4270)
MLLLIVSCEGGPTKVGSDLLPSSDFVVIASTDTLSVRSYTMYDNKFPTSDPAKSFIGSVRDPYFGTTSAGFVSQVRLSQPWTFGPVAVDSVRLFLRIVSLKGGASGQENILRISEIANQIFADSTYYSNTQTDTTDFEVTATLPPMTADTTNDIKISLPIDFGEYLIRDTTKLFYSVSEPDFRSFFKGVYFRLSSSHEPLMISFDLTSTVPTNGVYNNFFVIYLHDTAFVPHKYYFILDPVHKNVSYNKFTNDFTTADPDKRIPHINDLNYRDTLSYIQALNGVYTKIVFPGLDSLKKKLSAGRFSINKARLTVPVYYDGSLYTPTTVPPSLLLRYENKEGLKLDVPDYTIDDTHKFFDGNLYLLDSLYSFNIPKYIQLYLEDKNGDYKPELEIYQDRTGFRNVILKANASKTPVKFEMAFTKY